MLQQRLTPEYLRSQIIGVDEQIQTPFGKRPMLYADYTASGRGLHFIEDHLKQLLSHYANSHTEDDTSGQFTTALLHQAEQAIKDAVNAGSEGRVIACGSGATAAIDRMQQLVGVKLPAASRAQLDSLLQSYGGDRLAQEFSDHCRASQPVVFVGPYEHHSNEVSWRESLATVVEVGLTPDGEVDLGHLEQLLQAPEYQGRLRIGSFSAASNVTGMRSPVHQIAQLLHRHQALAFFDYAASAPYVSIDMNPADLPDDASLDAIFISPHKFLGGPGSSGILVFNQHCYHSELPPSIAGGGTVDYVGPDEHDFVDDIEARESAGTPGILQTIKAALAFQVKQAIGVDEIERREQSMLHRALAVWAGHPGIEILGNPDAQKRIGIVSFNIKGRSGDYLHPRFITRLLDDLFGIQSRAGCSCAGPYGHQLLGIDQQTAQEYRTLIAAGSCGIKPGWCRIGFHYTFDQDEFNYLVDAVTFVAEHGEQFLPLYSFEPSSGRWLHRKTKSLKASLDLCAALEASATVATTLDAEARGAVYRSVFEQAHRQLRQLASSPAREGVKIPGEVGRLQFFRLSKQTQIR